MIKIIIKKPSCYYDYTCHFDQIELLEPLKGVRRDERRKERKKHTVIIMPARRIGMYRWEGMVERVCLFTTKRSLLPNSMPIVANIYVACIPLIVSITPSYGSPHPVLYKGYVLLFLVCPPSHLLHKAIRVFVTFHTSVILVSHQSELKEVCSLLFFSFFFYLIPFLKSYEQNLTMTPNNFSQNPYPYL